MKKLTTFLVVLTVLVLGFFVWWSNATTAVDSKDTSSSIFVIEKGEGIREIANKLKSEGLIKDPVALFLLIKQEGLDSKIQAGDFRLSKSMDLRTIAQNLTHGTLDNWVTIPEGLRADEIADIFQKDLSTYQPSWRTQLEAHEGYLFPDTYLISRDATIDQIISIMTNNFEKKYSQITPNTTLTKSQIVILASLIEREARYDADRPLVASVIMNRINLGMALQIDATIQYALGYQPAGHTWWKSNLTADDLNIKSPYNTKLNVGLPPGPISNPGLAALSAAAYPAKSNYLYYISDKSGHNHYETTLEQHNADIQKYGI